MRISDWSSDVCSSDLEVVVEVSFDGSDDCLRVIASEDSSREETRIKPTSTTGPTTTAPPSFDVGTSPYVDVDLERSEESRVGNEWVSTLRPRWRPSHEKKTSKRNNKMSQSMKE